MKIVLIIYLNNHATIIYLNIYPNQLYTAPGLPTKHMDARVK